MGDLDEEEIIRLGPELVLASSSWASTSVIRGSTVERLVLGHWEASVCTQSVPSGGIHRVFEPVPPLNELGSQLSEPTWQVRHR